MHIILQTSLTITTIINTYGGLTLMALFQGGTNFTPSLTWPSRTWQKGGRKNPQRSKSPVTASSAPFLYSCSVGENSYCTSRGSRFSSHQASLVAHHCLQLQYQGIWQCLWTLLAPASAGTHTDRNKKPLYLGCSLIQGCETDCKDLKVFDSAIVKGFQIVKGLWSKWPQMQMFNEAGLPRTALIMLHLGTLLALALAHMNTLISGFIQSTWCQQRLYEILWLRFEITVYKNDSAFYKSLESFNFNKITL
jgi:hypothetical protein